MPRSTVCIFGSSSRRIYSAANVSPWRNRVTSETTRLLLELAEQSGLRQHIDATDSAHSGYRRSAGNNDPDLRCVQPRCRPHFLSGGVSVRQAGRKKRSARLVYHLPDRLSRLCADAEHLSCGCAVCLLRVVSRNIPRCRQGTRRISCRSIWAQAASAGTAAPRSACCNWWRASLLDCFGIGSAMRPCSITARRLLLSAASDCSC